MQKTLLYYHSENTKRLIKRSEVKKNDFEIIQKDAKKVEDIELKVKEHEEEPKEDHFPLKIKKNTQSLKSNIKHI